MSDFNPVFGFAAIQPSPCGAISDLFGRSMAYLDRCDPGLVDLVAARLGDQAVLRRLLDRLSELVDLLEDGRTGSAVVGEARSLLGEIQQHLCIGGGFDGIGADIGGDGDAQGEDPRLKSSQADVRLGDGGAILRLKGRFHRSILRLARLAAHLPATLTRVRRGGQS